MPIDGTKTCIEILRFGYSRDTRGLSRESRKIEKETFVCVGSGNLSAKNIENPSTFSSLVRCNTLRLRIQFFHYPNNRKPESPKQIFLKIAKSFFFSILIFASNQYYSAYLRYSSILKTEPKYFTHISGLNCRR